MEKVNHKKSRLVIYIFLFFGLIFSAISLPNHYNLRTFGLDLGVFNQILHYLSKFQMPNCTIWLEGKEFSFLNDHFSPITILYTPLYYLFGSWTFLILQIASVLFGGWGVYKYAQLKSENKNFPIIMLVQFFGIWGIYSALAHDFHNNVVGAMFVPWLLYHYEKCNKKMVLLFTFIILISKENMALWLAFIFIGLMFKGGYKNFKKYFQFEIPIVVFVLIYFVLIIKVVMPSLSNGPVANHLDRYSHLGNSLSEIIATLFTRPAYVFSLLFESFSNNPDTFGIKGELHMMVLASGGLAILFRPYYLIMLLPIYAQNLLSNDPFLHGINYQYSIEFAPILSFAIIDAALRFNTIKKQIIFVSVLAISTHAFNFKSLDKRKSIWYQPTLVKFYEKRHYVTIQTLKDLQPILDSIPENSSISAQNMLVPHLCNHDTVYLYPHIGNAKFIFLFTAETNKYPLDQKAYDEKLKKLLSSKEWKIYYEKKDTFLVLQRQHSIQ
ncbi:MAG: DUF2079 domain-containing protein [Bacteroidetes bacterium]|nr:DUF2079 domain-containing protein [Bacteroidota bacterium]